MSLKHLLFLIIIVGSTEYFAQSKCDTIITNELKEINAKLQDALESKDCEKVEKKLTKIIDTKSEEIQAKEALIKQKDTAIQNRQKKLDEISVKYNTLLASEKSFNDTKKALEKNIDDLKIEKTKLETDKTKLVEIQNERNKELETTKNQVKLLLSNSNYLDPMYLNLVIKTLKNDVSSEKLVKEVEAYIKSQTVFNEIDSLIKIETFIGFKEAKDKIEKTVISPEQKELEKHKIKIKSKLVQMGNIIEQYKQSNNEFSSLGEDKYMIKMYTKLMELKNLYREIFNTIPCVSYQFDKLMENRKDYKLPSTN
jgi:hypothetical protein